MGEIQYISKDFQSIEEIVDALKSMKNGINYINSFFEGDSIFFEFEPFKADTICFNPKDSKYAYGIYRRGEHLKLFLIENGKDVREPIYSPCAILGRYIYEELVATLKGEW